jgi:hypothetical protein
MHVISHIVKELPFNLDDAARPASDYEKVRTLQFL